MKVRGSKWLRLNGIAVDRIGTILTMEVLR